MPETRNDIPSNVRTAMIAMLNARLADALDLRNAVKHAHWNVRGPNFIALHEMFDAMTTRMADHADEIAERVTQLGGQAMGTVQTVAGDTKLAPYPKDASAQADHLKALAERFAAFGASTRAAIDEADEAGDKDTADIMTGVSRAVDKDLWFLEAHLTG
jgi:starvation-inducible DNA-binding protein